MTYDICYYSSDYYAPYTGISMYSLLENNKDLELRIHCIDSGISAINKEKMQKMVDSYGKQLLFHDYTNLEQYIKNDLRLPICNGSYATYIKVFPEKIFTDCEKILFIDGDTLIVGSIRPLFEMDLTDKVFSAAKVSLINEAWVYKQDDPTNLRLKYSHKFDKLGYFNIGIFLVNLKKWEEVAFGSKIMKAADEHLSTITKVDDIPIDEMLINLAVLKEENRSLVCPFSAVYNCVTHNIPFKRAWNVNKICGYIQKDDFTVAYFNPVIIHFCIFKPWFLDAYSPYYPLLRRYQKNSPWPDAFAERKYHTLPQKIFGRFFYPMQNENVILYAKKIWDLFHIKE